MDAYILKMIIKNALKAVLAENATFEYKFDSNGFLLDQHGKRFSLPSGVSVSPLMRKFSALGVSLEIVTDHRETFFKKI
jgi:hypothetical protein